MSYSPSSRIMHADNLSAEAKLRHRQLVERLNHSVSPAAMLAGFVHTAVQEQRPEDLGLVANVHVRAIALASAEQGSREDFTHLMEVLAPTPLVAHAPCAATRSASQWLLQQATYLADETEAKGHIQRICRLATALKDHRPHCNTLVDTLRGGASTLAQVAPQRAFTLLGSLCRAEMPQTAGLAPLMAARQYQPSADLRL